MMKNRINDHPFCWIKPLYIALLALALSACASNPQTAPPTGAAGVLPAAYSEVGEVGDLGEAGARGENSAGKGTGTALAENWWRAFGSAQLSSLIETALLDSADMKIALERIRQAQAQASIAGASLFPQLNASVGAVRRESRGGNSGAGNGSNGGTSNGTSNYSASLAASYEVDVWQKNSAAASSAQFALLATRHERASVGLSLTGGVASAYFQLLSLRQRIQLTQENIAIAQRILALVQVRVDAGAASALDSANQQAALLKQQAQLPPLQLAERQILHALALLLGQLPEGFVVASMALEDLNLPAVEPGLPSSLLLRRPDLASLEAQLAQAHANLAQARAALFPSISLTASAGAASSSLHELVSGPTLAISLGAGLLQPIFDAGRLRSEVAIAASRQQELALGYRKAVLVALAEVENALVARTRLAQQEHLLDAAQQQAARALRLAQVRYRAGEDDLIVMLEAQRTLFQAKDQRAQIRESRLQAAVALMKALGGAARMPHGMDEQRLHAR